MLFDNFIAIATTRQEYSTLENAKTGLNIDAAADLVWSSAKPGKFYPEPLRGVLTFDDALEVSLRCNGNITATPTGKDVIDDHFLSLATLANVLGSQ
jgi:hypothetical protein